MKTRDIILIALFTALITVGAYIKIPIPYIPITMQVFCTTLTGLLLGSKRGALSVIVYILLGLAGVPVFTGGGGLGYVFQPTFGYIIGFAVGAYFTGKIVEGSENPSLKRLFIACGAGLAAIYAFGLIYYWIIAAFYIGKGIALKTLFMYCFLLVIPGDIITCIIAAFIAKRILPILKAEGLRR